MTGIFGGTEKLNQVNWEVEFDDVRLCWNHFETNLLKIIDEIAPNKKFCLYTAIDKPNKIAKVRKGTLPRNSK